MIGYRDSLLDFLPKKTRKRLLKYQFIRAYLEGRDSKELYLDNLKRFDQELKEFVAEIGIELLRGMATYQEHERALKSMTPEERKNYYKEVHPR